MLQNKNKIKQLMNNQGTHSQMVNLAAFLCSQIIKTHEC